MRGEGLRVLPRYPGLKGSVQSYSTAYAEAAWPCGTDGCDVRLARGAGGRASERGGPGGSAGSQLFGRDVQMARLPPALSSARCWCRSTMRTPYQRQYQIGGSRTAGRHSASSSTTCSSTPAVRVFRGWTGSWAIPSPPPSTRSTSSHGTHGAWAAATRSNASTPPACGPTWLQTRRRRLRLKWRPPWRGRGISLLRA